MTTKTTIIIAIADEKLKGVDLCKAATLKTKNIKL